MATSIYQDEAENELSPLAVDAAKAAVLIGVCESTIRKLVKLEKIPHRYIGRRLLFIVEELKKWLADRES